MDPIKVRSAYTFVQADQELLYIVHFFTHFLTIDHIIGTYFMILLHEFSFLSACKTDNTFYIIHHEYVFLNELSDIKVNEYTSKS